MDEARARWLGRARAEATSADLFERLATAVRELGLPNHLADDLRTAAGDERRHAAACLQVAGEDDAGEGTLDLPPVDTTDSLVRFTCDVAYLLAAGETVAVALLRASVRPPCHEDIAAVLTSTLADEQRHAALGWALIDAALAVAPQHRPTLARLLPLQAARVVHAAAAAAPDTDELRPWGVLGRGAAREIAQRAFVTEVAPQLAARGVWSAPRGA